MNLPDIFEHVEHLGREVGVGHIKFCEVRLQHWGRGLLSLKDGHLLLKAQDPAQERVTEAVRYDDKGPSAHDSLWLGE